MHNKRTGQEKTLVLSKQQVLLKYKYYVLHVSYRYSKDTQKEERRNINTPKKEAHCENISRTL